MIAFFVSGASGASPDASTTIWDAPRNEPPVTETSPPIGDPPVLPEIDIVWILLAAGIVVVLGIVLMLVGAIMEFVFVQVVTDREVQVRGYFSENVSNGVSLFLFRILIILGAIALVALPAVLFFLLSPFLLVLLAILLIPVLIVTGVGIWIILRFTADFVVPVMLLEGEEIIEAWRDFWPTLVENWKQYGVYALVRLGLGIVAGFIAGFGFAAIGITLAIPFGIVAVIVYLLFEVVAGLLSLTIVALVILGTLYAISVLVVGVTLVQVPIQTYLRYYSLFVLGSITPPFDMVEPLRPRETPRSEEGGNSHNV